MQTENGELDWKERHSRLESAVKVMESQNTFGDFFIDRLKSKIIPDEEATRKTDAEDFNEKITGPEQTASRPDSIRSKTQHDVPDVNDLKLSDFDALIEATEATEPSGVKRTMRQKLG